MELGPAIALAGGEADQCKVGRGVAIQRRWRGSKHRAAPQLLSARTVAKAKVQTAHCKLTTLLLVLLLNRGREHVAMAFIICHQFTDKSQSGVNPMDLILLPLFFWKDWL